MTATTTRAAVTPTFKAKTVAKWQTLTPKIKMTTEVSSLQNALNVVVLLMYIHMYVCCTTSG
ncbi:hypothetical protein DOY81_004906 [Sarcophaga bullata]|nr:hypothetical protein DOY81_004906 [Sarcophaga bullata]